MDRKRSFTLGMKHGLPIGLGYFAVSFSLGIAAKDAGMTPWQGFMASLLTISSSGEYAGFRLMIQQAAYIEMAVMTLVANARYLLMSCSLSQKFSPQTPFFHRLTIGAAVTDELFGLAIGRPGWLDTTYYYGAMLTSIPLWALGTALGIIMGSILPANVVSALSVSLYGMFLAVVIPAGKKNRTILVLIILSFIASTISSYIPALSGVSEGTKIIILTVVISALASIVKPVPNEPEKWSAPLSGTDPSGSARRGNGQNPADRPVKNSPDPAASTVKNSPDPAASPVKSSPDSAASPVKSSPDSADITADEEVSIHER